MLIGRVMGPSTILHNLYFTHPSCTLLTLTVERILGVLFKVVAVLPLIKDQIQQTYA
jgi:hypothetical protein